MVDQMQELPRTAAVLARWRQQMRLSKQRLADLSDVSATYVRTIEDGRDAEGRTVVPSAAVMQKLAHGLAQAEGAAGRRPAVERDAYAELRAAGGYLDPIASAAPAPPVEKPLDQAPPRQQAVLPEAPEGPVTVVLRDPRLWPHARPLLEGWESLEEDDQALLLQVLAYVHSRRTLPLVKGDA